VTRAQLTTLAIALMAGLSSAEVASQGAAGAAPTMARATLDKYCVSCHNQRLKTAGLMLDLLDVNNVGSKPDVWEKVVRKLRSASMPPVGVPRPDKATYEALSSSLESELDHAAKVHPNPGGPLIRRLNRTEYQNVVRDLLKLDVSASSLLPADDAAFGFDNIAGALKVSPDLLDAYLAAANKISRLAVGDKALSLGSATYRVSEFYFQTDRMSDELPFGSRGGTAIHHYFPYDGEYVVKVEITGIPRPAEQIDVRIAGTAVKRLSTQGGRRDEAPGLEIRLPVKAGPRLVGVSIVKQAVEPESRLPELFPWGNSAATNPGASNYLKITKVDISGPFAPTGPGDTPSRRRIFVCQPTTPATEEPCAKKILTSLARQAFRRPVTETNVLPLLRIYRKWRQGRSFDGGIQAAVERLLVDPNFLFRVERAPANVKSGSVYPVSDLDLATRLSFFLWSSIPDEELLQAAERGKLREFAEFQRQVRRMLADGRSDMLVKNFAVQWLYLRNLKGLTPDSFEFPDWDDDLRDAMRQETELFLQSQIQENHSLIDLLTADYTFLNERLAKHYGIPDVYGSRFRRVKLPAHHRTGLLGQASILAITSNPNRTSPVQRGKWILENLLGTPPPPPPPNVPPFPETPNGQQPKTVRARMEQHRANPVCAGCHANMDPLGFAMENFDAIGTWRDVADGSPVDSSAALPDGTKLNGPHGLLELVSARQALFLETVTEKLLTFALGRGIEPSDMPAVRRIVKEAAANNYRWSSLILGVTNSTPFQMSLRRADQNVPH
jgi:mono/diheme cytochrome c family protein